MYFSLISTLGATRCLIWQFSPYTVILSKVRGRPAAGLSARIHREHPGLQQIAQALSEEPVLISEKLSVPVWLRKKASPGKARETLAPRVNLLSGTYRTAVVW
jgi:hypothetical protein